VSATHDSSPEALAPRKVVLGEKFVKTLWSQARHKALYGGRGSAKSWSIATYLSILSAERSKRIACCRQYQNSIRESSKELIEKRIEALGLTDGFTITDTQITHKSTGANFIFLGLDRSVESIRSLEGVDIVWVDEARSIKAKSLEILLPTVRKSGSSIIYSWNPEFRDDAVDHYFRGGVQPPNSIVTRVSWRDNPWFYTTALAQESETLKRGNPSRWRHVYDGDYDEHSEQRIFTGVNVGRVEVPANTPAYYGLDFGFGQDPSFITKVYVIDGNPRKLYVAGEAFGRVSMDALPGLVRAVVRHDDDRVIADSSQPGTIGFLHARGLNVVPSRKGAGSVKSGINWLRGLEIWIAPDCPGMIEESRLYSWMTDRAGKVLNTPVDANNHGFDSIRYAVQDLIENDVEGDGSAAVDDGGVIKLSLWRKTRR